MKHLPTLLDEVYRLACRNKTNPGWKDNTKVRHALERARRFVVDDQMSSFMADLSNESFIKAGEPNPLSNRIADSIRVQARLPYDAIWVEYNLRAYQKRANEIHRRPPLQPDECPWREGWLIQQHPNIDTAYILHIWTQNAPDDPLERDGFSMWTFPFAFAWCADDSPLPWRGTVSTPSHKTASPMITGIGGYFRDNVNCVQSPLINDPFRHEEILPAYSELLTEWSGVVRRVWAFLATINDMPTTYGTVRQTKGFLARGKIRKFLDHSTITLNIPARKDARVLARQLIAIAHRKRHPVRAHWREDWRYPPAKQCKHLWEIMDDKADRIECSLCHGRETYIHKHERGDATLGFVTHSYHVTHKEREDG